jgi:hypothetical protein
MATPAKLEAKIKLLDWNGLRALWKAIQAGKPPGWEGGEALEYLVIRAFEIDPLEPATVRYPYEVSLFGEKVEEIDGAVHLPGLSCLVESKDSPRKPSRSRRSISPISRCRRLSCSGRDLISRSQWMKVG